MDGTCCLRHRAGCSMTWPSAHRGLTYSQQLPSTQHDCNAHTAAVSLHSYNYYRTCIFKDQFLTEVYSVDSITAIFNVYFYDDGTVLLDKKLNMTIISKCSFKQHTWQIERPCGQET